MTSLDALPYHDKELEHSNLKSRAQAAIQAELASTPKVDVTDSRLGPEVEIFESESLKTLLASYPSKPLSAIDPSRYAIPEGLDASTPESEWEEAEKRARIGLGHMAVRNENASILSQYAPNAYLVRNFQLDSQTKELQSTIEQHKELLVDLNRARRVYQEEKGTHLASLEGRWQDLVGSTVQLEMATGAMEGEVRALERREKELLAELQ